MMRGVLLRSGKSEDFTALGETGQPVYRAALQLREAIRRKNPDQPELVEHLAIPQTDERGSTIDWYSDRPGDVIPWSSATEEERAPARAQLEVLQRKIDELSNDLLGLDADGQPLPGSKPGAQGDRTVFGKLLTCVVPFPDENFVYLVDGRPVLTFWGFVHAGAERSRQPLHCLYPSTAKVAEPAPPAPVAPLAAPAAAPLLSQATKPSWWRRWWWLLPLLLLLLLLLLFGLRGCLPNAALPGLPGMPQVEVPSMNVPSLNGQPGVTLPGGAALPGSGLNVSGNTAGMPNTAPGSVAAPANEDAGTGSAANTAPEPTTAPPVAPDEAPASAAQTPPANAGAPANAPSTQPPALAEGTQPSPLLSIPADAADGTANFLNGDWSGAGIQEVGTGKPLRLKYDFQDGKGNATVSRSDGVRCSAPVVAAMNGGNLSINSDGQAACADGSSYDLPQVNCKPGAQHIADCSGSYGTEAFPMLMKQAGQ